MQEIQKPEIALILTARLDHASQTYFDSLRKQHFPPERNFLHAHLTLFHKLPNTSDTSRLISDAVSIKPFTMQAIGLFNLGAGVAFRIESESLRSLRARLVSTFSEELSLQDKQGFRGHITVQNKTSPENARSLLSELSLDFTPFEVTTMGLDLWYYLGGPWKHKQFFAFR